MMYDFEYNNIIDHWSKEFNIHVGDTDRTKIINLYEIEESKATEADIDLDFDMVCHQVLLRSYCMDKYPQLNLFDTVYSIWGMN